MTALAGTIFEVASKITVNRLHYMKVFPLDFRRYELDHVLLVDAHLILKQCCNEFRYFTQSFRDPLREEVCGWHPIHLAAFLGEITCLERIIEYDPLSVNINLSVRALDVTPLMCAAVGGSTSTMKYLFDHNAAFSKNPSVELEWAIKGKKAASFLFVWKNAEITPSLSPIDIFQYFSVGILEDDSEILEAILTLIGWKKAKISSFPNDQKRSITSEAHTVPLSRRLQASQFIRLDTTKLFFFALEKGYSDVVKTLLKMACSPTDITQDGLPPLHFAISKHLKDETAAIMVHILLNNGGNVNQLDKDKKTPLYYAARAGFKICSFMLIQWQAEICTSDMIHLNERVPNFLKMHLNNQISSKGVTSSPSGELVSIDLRFMGTLNSEKDENRELNFLEYIVSDGQDELLIHPTIQTFLHVKWVFLRKFFIFSVTFHVIQLIFYSIYITMIYTTDYTLDETSHNQNHTRTASTTDGEDIEPTRNSSSDESLVTLGIIGTCSIIASRAVYIGFFSFVYIKSKNFSRAQIFRFIFEILTIIVISITLLPSMPFYRDPSIPIWLRAIAAISILVVWCNTLWYFTRHPELGIYIEMLLKVFKNFATFFATYACMLIGYALSFSVMLNGKAPFQTVLTSIREVLRMMVGEVELELDVEQLNVLTYVLYLAFMLTVTIALINLLIGLAVHDIQGLLLRSTISKSIIQIQYMNLIESVIYSETVSKSPLLPNAFRNYLRKCIKIKLPNKDQIIFVFPNKSDDKRLPYELKQSALKVARKNAENEKKRQT